MDGECGVRSSAVASVSKARADYGGPCDSCPRVASAEHADRAETANRRDGCLLSKLHEAKHHVNVTVDMDELDITSAESKATYEEIRNWVQEQYGFHVTNLNIAQIKQKHGIIERENYNKAK